MMTPAEAVGERAVPAVSAWQRSLVMALVIAGGLLTFLVPPALWVRDLVLNTDRYVAAVAPLSHSPAVQEAVIRVVDTQVEQRLKLAPLIGRLLPKDEAEALAGPLEAAARTQVQKIVTDVVDGPDFPELWNSINRTAHSQIVALLTKGDSGVLKLSDDEVLLDLGPVVQVVKTRLVASGFAIASAIPITDVKINLVELQGLQRVRSAVSVLDDVANLLPWLAVVCFAAAIGFSRTRRRTTMIVALSVAGAMALVGIAIQVGRIIVLDRIPADAVSPAALRVVFDAMTTTLRDGVRTALLAAVVIALIALLVGSSPVALQLRQTVRNGADRLAERRNAVRALIVGVAVLLMVFWSNPTPFVLIAIAVIAAILIVIIELVRTSDDDLDAA